MAREERDARGSDREPRKMNQLKKRPRTVGAAGGMAHGGTTP
jgi:hypothetical protein